MDEDEPGTVPGQHYQAEASPFRPPPRRPLLQRIVPVAEHIAGYRRQTLGRDALAGVTVAALALPAGMAYAELAGLSPVNGLYALLLPAVAYAVLGSARMLIVGPEGAIAAMVGAALIPMTQDPGERASLAALLALLVGAAYLAALLARLGWIADYLSLPVLIGYIHGVALVMIVSQVPKLVGLDISAESPPGQVVEVVQEISQLNPATAVVGGSCLVVLLLARWLVPKLPASLIVVVLAIAASAALGLAQYGVAVVGEVPAGLPGFSVPNLQLRAILDILPAALGIFVVSFRRHETPTSAQTTNPGSRITNHEIATVTPDNASSNTNSAKVGNVHNAATDAAQLAALQRRSQDLERWLSETGDVAAPLQGQDLLAATEIENLIGLVDVELTAKRQMQDTGLWKRRVDLLEDLSALRYSNYQLAAGGRVIAASLTN